MNTDDISPIVREQAPLILAEIKKANSILLHCHPSPDPDSTSSVLAMKFALEQMGKKVTVIRGDSEIPRGFLHFPGAKDILAKSFGEIDLGQFDLFISLDSASPQMVSNIHVPVFPLPIRTIVIDHHATNTKYADLNLVDTSAPAAAFILFQLFTQWNIQFTHDIAANLFMGIYTDTGGFRYPPTDYRTFKAAAELVRVAPDFTQMIFGMENSNSPESIYFQALALSSIETFLDDNLAIASVSHDALVQKGIPEEAMHSDISNHLKSIIGWNIGISLIERKAGQVKASIRTRDRERFDVSKLASVLGGGGHKAAAGATLKMSLPEAKKLVVAKAKELYNL